MTVTHYDLIIIGQGLAGSLSALAYQLQHPTQKLLILESQPFRSARHTWSCFDTDWPLGLQYLKQFLQKYQTQWPTHQVCFPDLERHLSIGYQSLREADLLLAWQDTESPHRHCLYNVTDLQIKTLDHVGFQVQAQASHQNLQVTSSQLWDARGWGQWEQTPCAYQKFIGWEVELSQPHGLVSPVIMDALVEQIDGYRFFYILPYSPTRLLIEDTYYSNGSELNKKIIDFRIAQYAQQKGWVIKDIIHQEQGVLPLPLMPPPIPQGLGQAIGARGLYFHPVTGYTLPFLLRQIDSLINSKKQQPLSCQHPWIWYQLNHFLFLSNSSQLRINFFKFFYRLPEKIVTSFFSGQIKFHQWVIFFSHWPPPLKVGEALNLCFQFLKRYHSQATSKQN